MQHKKSKDYAKVELGPAETVVADLTRGLIQEGCEQGNWDDARGTGDALIALSEALAPDDIHVGQLIIPGSIEPGHPRKDPEVLAELLEQGVGATEGA